PAASRLRSASIRKPSTVTIAVPANGDPACARRRDRRTVSPAGPCQTTVNARDETNSPDAGFTAECGALPGATRDRQSITRDWMPLQKLIDGVAVREVRNVPKDNGYLAEIWRADWRLDGAVAHLFQALLAARRRVGVACAPSCDRSAVRESRDD